MRARTICTVAAAALASLVALPSGAQSSPTLLFSVTAEMGPVHEMLGEEVAAAPARGRYFVLDFSGVLCEARLVRSRELTAMLETGVAPYQYELRVAGAQPCWTRTLDNERHIVAVGPLTRRPQGARLMAMGLALAGHPTGSVPIDTPGVALPNSEHVEYAVDLDGDGRVDLVSRVTVRPLPSRTRGSFRIAHHRETWSRTPTTWLQTVSTAWTIEAPIE
ncbi:MAG: hypothetical protein M3Y87_32190 [Myxococcota bacterium]|nr:hypothetical protein [Myxococcota bacterium]